MDGYEALRQEVLRSNWSLRVWAAALRYWSKETRATSRTTRDRARSLLEAAAPRRPLHGAAIDPGSVVTPADAMGDEPQVPGLGMIGVGELFAVLVDRHHLGAWEAARGLANALAAAGYPPESDAVAAADALGMVEWVLRAS
jgi:hypothetical protein